MRFLIFVLLLFACEPDWIDTWDAWKVDKGKHESHRTGLPKPLVSLFDGSTLQFQARFTDSCLYTPEDDDIHKLYGITDCNATVHQNSVRIGWRHNGKGQIEIFAYWYVDGDMNFHKLGETIPYTPDEYEVKITKDEYQFRFNDVTYSTPRKKHCEHGVRVRCFPHFGGNKAAPQDILIFIYEYS